VGWRHRPGAGARLRASPHRRLRRDDRGARQGY
jgi:hypothetical protein